MCGFVAVVQRSLLVEGTRSLVQRETETDRGPRLSDGRGLSTEADPAGCGQSKNPVGVGRNRARWKRFIKPTL